MGLSPHVSSGRRRKTARAPARDEHSNTDDASALSDAENRQPQLSVPLPPTALPSSTGGAATKALLPTAMTFPAPPAASCGGGCTKGGDDEVEAAFRETVLGAAWEGRFLDWYDVTIVVDSNEKISHRLR